MLATERVTDQQLFGLDTDMPVRGLSISFPDGYSPDDMDAIWKAIYEVQRTRGLLRNGAA